MFICTDTVGEVRESINIATVRRIFSAARLNHVTIYNIGAGAEAESLDKEIAPFHCVLINKVNQFFQKELIKLKEVVCHA